MVEPEMAFFELTDNMDLAEAFLKRVMPRRAGPLLPRTSSSSTSASTPRFWRRWSAWLPASSCALTYTEAVEVLSKSRQAFEFPTQSGADLQSEHERYLTEEHFQKPVILYDYPQGIKAFYMRLNDDGKTVRAMDVLVPRIGEIIGGSQREERLDVLSSSG